MSLTHIQSERISCRVSLEYKKLVEQAGKISGFSMSGFITHVLVSAASEIVLGDAVIHLTKDEWDRFMSSLEQPASQPNEATKKAVTLFN